jgi:serine/threonine protein kinase
MDTSNPIADSGLPEGTQLNSYRIQGELGRGGFGITYKALDTRLDRPVVIKEYLPQDFAARRGDLTVGPRLAGQAENFQLGLDSFLKEAQTLAKFHHPSIVPVLDFFQIPNGTAYMVMPFLEGETLAAKLDRSPGGRLSEAEILSWLSPLLDGLQAIHAAGFLHRDIKPENIYLLQSGQPMLIDFGSARNALVNRSRSLSVVLTPGYAPVEQYSSTATTQGPWTDLYALGAVLYRCLTGFAPSDSTERQDATINDEPDPLRLKFENLSGLASPTLKAAVEGCLRLARKDRIQGVAELRQILAGSPVDAPKPISGESKSALPVKPSSPSEIKTKSDWWLGVCVAVLALMIGAAGVAVYYLANKPEPVALSGGEEAGAADGVQPTAPAGAEDNTGTDGVTFTKGNQNHYFRENAQAGVVTSQSLPSFSSPAPTPSASRQIVPNDSAKDFSPSFDCAKASSPVEHTICADPVLAELDVALAARYRQALGSTSNKEALRSRQRQWLKQREQCADASDIFQCIQRHYRERLSQF